MIVMIVNAGRWDGSGSGSGLLMSKLGDFFFKKNFIILLVCRHRTATFLRRHTTNWTSSSSETYEGGSGGFRPMCTATGALTGGEKRGTLSGSIPRRTSIDTASSGLPTISCKSSSNPLYCNNLSCYFIINFAFTAGESSRKRVISVVRTESPVQLDVG